MLITFGMADAVVAQPVPIGLDTLVGYGGSFATAANRYGQVVA